MIYDFTDLSFRILTVERFSHQDGAFDVKKRPFAALSFRVSGTGAFEIGSQRFTTKQGDVLFLPADTAYKVEYSVSESIVVHLDGCNYSEAENIKVENSSEMRFRFELLLEEWLRRHSVNQAKSMVYDILDKMENSQKMLIKDSVVADCVRCIQEHYSDPELCVEKLCAGAYVSVSTIQRAFERFFGISPGQYLIRERLRHALELLSESELSVKEISFACGFTDEKYFSRAFKKKYGYPPSQVRNR